MLVLQKDALFHCLSKHFCCTNGIRQNVGQPMDCRQKVGEPFLYRHLMSDKDVSKRETETIEASSLMGPQL